MWHVGSDVIDGGRVTKRYIRSVTVFLYGLPRDMGNRV